MDTVIKEEKLRDPYNEVPMIVSTFFKRAADDHVCKPLANRQCIHATVWKANEVGCLRAWYGRDGELVGVLMFDTASEWWTTEPVVVELMVLKIDDSYAGLQRLAIRELDRIARGCNSRLIATGNLLSYENQAVENGYRKHGGYQATTKTFLKRLKSEADCND